MPDEAVSHLDVLTRKGGVVGCERAELRNQEVPVENAEEQKQEEDVGDEDKKPTEK